MTRIAKLKECIVTKIIVLKIVDSGFKAHERFKCGDVVKFNWMANWTIPSVTTEGWKVIFNITKYNDGTAHAEFIDMATGEIDGADVFWLARPTWLEQLRFPIPKPGTYIPIAIELGHIVRFAEENQDDHQFDVRIEELSGALRLINQSIGKFYQPIEGGAKYTFSGTWTPSEETKQLIKNWIDESKKSK